MLRKLIATLAICLFPTFAFAQNVAIEVLGASKDPLVFEEVDVILIGRDETNHIRLSGSFVSRSHAKITCFTADCLLTDLRSTNGTLLNGVPVQYGQNAVLRNGDVIEIGDQELGFFLR